MLDESARIARLIGEPLDLLALCVPLIHLRLLLPIAVKAIPGECEHIPPSQLRHPRVASRQVIAVISSYCDETDAKPEIADMNAVAIDICCGLFDAAGRKATDCCQHAVDVLQVASRPRAVQGAGIVRL